MNISMKVPDVVQMTRMMMTNIATDGPDEPVPDAAAEDSGLRPAGVVDADGVEGQVQQSAVVAEPLRPVDAEEPRNALTAPLLEKRKRKTVAIAIELVTDGK